MNGLFGKQAVLFFQVDVFFSIQSLDLPLFKGLNTENSYFSVSSRSVVLVPDIDIFLQNVE